MSDVNISKPYISKVTGSHRCEVYHSERRVAWMAYFKDTDQIVYFNDLASVKTIDKERAMYLFREALVEEILLEN